jgi:hypothetical protein
MYWPQSPCSEPKPGVVTGELAQEADVDESSQLQCVSIANLAKRKEEQERELA